MKHPRRHFLWLALALVAASGCASAPDGGPEQAVQGFYTHLNDGNYGAAIGLYSAEALSVLQDPDSASDSAFAAWAKEETKEGSVDRVEVVQQEATGDDSATVEFRVVYRDGSTAEHTVTVTRESGAWKMGLIG